MVKYLATIAGALLIGWTAFPPTVQAQAMCGDRTEVVSKLKKGYSETPVSIGLASNGAVIEVFASTKGSFTIIMTRPNGLSCLMAAGDSWELLPKRNAGSRT